jgi:VanZ family protein
MTVRHDRHLAAWLLLGVTFLIVYASLYPFGFARVEVQGLADLLDRLPWARTTRSDIAANVLLYLPFGACLGWLLASRLGGPLALAGATLAGVVLSTGIEVAQIFETRRVASLADVFFNGLGSLAGGALALALRSARHGFSRHPLARLLAQPVPAALLLLWLGYRLAPFALTLDPGQWLAALAPLGQSPGSWASPQAAVGYLVGWLVAARALAELYPRRGPTAVLGITMAVVLAGTVLMSGKALDPNELAAMAAVLLLSLPLSRARPRQSAALLAALLAAWILLDGLAPFDFRLDPDAFGLVPFRDALTRYRSTNLIDMFHKCFAYGALVWLLMRAGLRVLGATLAAVGLLLVVELLQAWLPGKAADITDPLLALVAGGLIAVFDPGTDRGGGLRLRS